KKLDESVDDASKLKMAIADYNTVRQGIFKITHKEAVYYDPDEGDVVPSSKAVQASEAKAFKDKYESKQTDHINLGPILGLMALLLLVPAYIIFVWARRHHSVLSYQIENNLLEDVGQNKYH